MKKLISAFLLLTASCFSNQESPLYELFHSPWTKYVKEMEGKFGEDHRFTKYLNDFQCIHFHIGGSDGYEGACFLPGKFHETEYLVEENGYTIRHSTNKAPSATFTIVKPPASRSTEELKREYEENFGSDYTYESIAPRKCDSYISQIHTFQSKTHKTFVYLSDEGQYEFWISTEREEGKMGRLREDSVLWTFRLGTDCIFYPYEDLGTLFIEHPLQRLIIDETEALLPAK